MSAAPGQGPSGRDQDPVRAGHAPGAVQPDPTWGWDVAGNPIEEADGWRPVPPGTDPMADPDAVGGVAGRGGQRGGAAGSGGRSWVVPGSGGSGAAG